MKIPKGCASCLSSERTVTVCVVHTPTWSTKCYVWRTFILPGIIVHTNRQFHEQKRICESKLMERWRKKLDLNEPSILYFCIEWREHKNYWKCYSLSFFKKIFAIKRHLNNNYSSIVLFYFNYWWWLTTIIEFLAFH